MQDIPRPVGIVILVGGPQYRVGSHRQFVLLARDLARGGYPVLRFDYAGMGDSYGSPPSFEDVGKDISAAIDALLRAVPGLSQVVLWGLCDGASSAMMYCSEDARVAALIVANPWVRTDAAEARSYVRHYYLDRLRQRSFWQKVLTGHVAIGASVRDLLRKVGASRAIGEGTTCSSAVPFITRMLAGLTRFRGPVLILTSERDLTARAFLDLAAESREWLAATTRPGVTHIELPETDHTFSSRATLNRASDECLRWLRMLPAASVLGSGLR
jgi:uncharacterized protein